MYFVLQIGNVTIRPRISIAESEGQGVHIILMSRH